MLRKPSNDRDWKADVAKLAKADLNGNIVTIHNVRNNRYPSPDEAYDVFWETRDYDLSNIKRLWFLLEHFHPSLDSIAHPFLSFEFEEGFLCLSIEARLTKDNPYSIAKGLVGSYELTYSFGNEQDFIVRRSFYQGHKLYLYPLVTPPIEILTLLLGVIATANALIRRPRFYNSVANNCTNTLRRHANQVRPGSFPPFIWADLLPGLSSKVLYNKGWIDTNVPFANLYETYAVNEKASTHKDDPEFSRLIRQTALTHLNDG